MYDTQNVADTEFQCFLPFTLPITELKPTKKQVESARKKITWKLFHSVWLLLADNKLCYT